MAIFLLYSEILETAKILENAKIAIFMYLVSYVCNITET